MAEHVNLAMINGSLSHEQYTFEFLSDYLHFIDPLSILGYQNDELFPYFISSFLYGILCMLCVPWEPAINYYYKVLL